MFFLQSLQALMNECIGHVIGKPHSPVTGLYFGKMLSCGINCWLKVDFKFILFFKFVIMVTEMSVLLVTIFMQQRKSGEKHIKKLLVNILN